MAKKEVRKHPLDTRGGVLIMSCNMVRSEAFMTLPATAKVLMILLQLHWREFEPVSYGVREAAEKIGCTPNSAGKAFKILHERGFISCAKESFFYSKTGSRTREWRLNWMPWEYKEPTNEWEKWQQKINSTVSK